MDMNTNTAVEQITETIMIGIKKGTFKTGGKIPSQRKLSSLFGVSRTVVREAVKVLEGRNILVSRKGSGTYVNQYIDEKLGLYSDGEEKYTLEEILDFSRLIWNASISVIVKNATDEELETFSERIHKFYQGYSSKTTNQEKFIYESSFGTNICKLTHNNLIYKMVVELLKSTSDVDFKIIESNENFKTILEIDRKLVEALKNRDEPRAKLWAAERDIEISKVIDADQNVKSEMVNKKYIINIKAFLENGL